MDTLLIKKLGIQNLSSLMEYTEKMFTTSRFEEMHKSVANLLSAIKKEDLRSYIVLVAFDIAGYMAENKPDKIPEKFNKLILSLQNQSEDFYLHGWTFNGTKHYVQTSPKLREKNRQWLVSFFSALEEKNRSAMVDKLRKLENDR
jgi:hypothetical protein